MQVDPDIGVETTIKRGLLPHMHGCKQDEHCTIFHIPRGYERHDSGITTLFRICRLQYILKHAPRPSNSKSRGKRPHGHGDNENLFKDERVTLLTLEGEPFQDTPTPERGGRTTVMWTYPAKVYTTTTLKIPRATQSRGTLLLIQALSESLLTATWRFWA